jgi:hypothetical protein
MREEHIWLDTPEASRLPGRPARTMQTVCSGTAKPP